MSGSVGAMSAAPRIVCLVPSITELLCDLGLSEHVVGRTGFCVHPWETVREIPKVGGTKDVLMDRVRELEPTHVVVNVDENLKEDAEALAARLHGEVEPGGELVWDSAATNPFVVFTGIGGGGIPV